MSQNIEEDRKNWPKDHDDFTVSSKTINSSQVWQPPSDYPAGGKYHKVRAWTYRSGQSVEVDETPGGERIRVINSDGSFMEMQHDGKWVHRSQDSSYEIVGADKNVRVKGATNIQVDGDVNMKIGGALTGEVAGITNLSMDGGVNLKTPFLKITGNEVSHNGINIGHDHKHRDVVPGDGISGIPLPI